MPVLADKSGSVGILFGLLAPLLLLAAALAIDATAATRDTLHLQALADRTAISAGPLWLIGNPKSALAITQALIAADETAHIDHIGGPPTAFEITLSSPRQQLFPGPAPRLTARAIARGPHLIQ